MPAAAAEPPSITSFTHTPSTQPSSFCLSSNVVPDLSIGVSDSLEIREKLEHGPVTATLVVDNEVEIDAGTTYNITGVLKGKSSEHQILIGGHYDAHDDAVVGPTLLASTAEFDKREGECAHELWDDRAALTDCLDR